MASKIIPFVRPKPTAETRSALAPRQPAERVEALPEWIQDLDVAWIFDAAERRMKSPRL